MFALYASKIDGEFTIRRFIGEFQTEDEAYEHWRNECASWELDGYGMDIRLV